MQLAMKRSCTAWGNEKEASKGEIGGPCAKNWVKQKYIHVFGREKVNVKANLSLSSPSRHAGREEL